MKTCKNCSAVNISSAIKCESCNFENHFTLHIISDENVGKEVKAGSVQCKNCGDQQGLHEMQCTTCRFPLSSVKMKSVSPLSPFSEKRTG